MAHRSYATAMVIKKKEISKSKLRWKLDVDGTSAAQMLGENPWRFYFILFLGEKKGNWREPLARGGFAHTDWKYP